MRPSLFDRFMTVIAYISMGASVLGLIGMGILLAIAVGFILAIPMCSIMAS